MSLTKERRAEIESEIINAIGMQPDVSITQKAIADKCGVSAQTISRIIHKMEQSGRILSSKNGRGKMYNLPKIFKTYEYKIEGLTEDKVYKDIVADFIEDVPKCVKENFTHAFMEILNNAIEHSNGTKVEVELLRSESGLVFSITDDGIGIFTKIADALKLDEKRYAILELAKGKFTTDPESHTGEGIFFSSKCGDLFTIESDGIEFITDQDFGMLEEPLEQSVEIGTRVILEISMAHKQSLNELFKRYTDAPESYGFSKTVIPIRLLEYGDKTPVLVSRSQARRLLARVERFNVVCLDFSGVDTIGQGFADEVFRVFKTNHPGVALIPMNCSEEVNHMIQHTMDYK